MIKVRFATKEDARAISNICSKSWKVTYANIYSKDYIDKVIDDSEGTQGKYQRLV